MASDQENISIEDAVPHGYGAKLTLLATIIDWVTMLILGIGACNAAFRKSAHDTKGTTELDWINHIVAPLLVTLIISTVTWLLAVIRMKRVILAAPTCYVKHLDELIKRGITEGPENAIVNARAIVAARDSMRGSMISIAEQLNSQIDTLAIDIGQDVERFARQESKTERRRPNGEAAYETIRVLERTWPAKRDQIKIEIRKLLTELGLRPA